MGLALAVLAGVTVLVALVSEIFVESVQQAALDLGMSQAFVGFIVVALVGGAAEMASAFSGARKNRLDLSVGIALGSAAQIALFVAPVLVLVSYFIGPSADEFAILAGCRGDDALRHPHRLARDQQRALGVVHRGPGADGVCDLCHDALSVAAPSAVNSGNNPLTPKIITRMPDDPIKSAKRVLEPNERIAEVLFGLIMVLTFTGSLSVAEADRAEVRTMLIGALGCNLAWGIIDAVLYLMGSLSEKGTGLLTLRAVRNATDPNHARRLIADALPSVVASVLEPAELDTMHQRLKQLPEPPGRARLHKDDWLGALGVFFLVFVSTFPVAIPFIFMHDAGPALRVSNAIAIVLLFILGYAFGRGAAHNPWVMGISMVALGMFLVGMTMALGG